LRASVRRTASAPPSVLSGAVPSGAPGQRIAGAFAITLLEILRLATGHLERNGSGSPRLDAELLLAHSLGIRRLDLYLQFERPLSETELKPYRELLARRARGEPVAYLTGRKEFMKLEFEVTPDVLVPNPDTELLVQQAVAWGREKGPLVLADVGTGSGCIAVALAHYLPAATVVGIDVSKAALEVAARNASRLGVGDRVELREGDLLAPLAEPADAICANLPYLDEDADPLPAEVLAQPRTALFTGDGGAALIKRLLADAPAHLRPGGRIFLEIDPGIAEALEPPFAHVEIHRDLNGLERLLEAWND
jgi:release factor glutamine methyltransferase